MKELLLSLGEAVLQKEGLILATIVASSGSTPRGGGARMLISPRGRLFGTIGGGITEYLAEEEGKALIQEGRSLLKDYRLYPNQKADIGARCGGELTLYFQYLDPGNPYLPLLIEKGIDCFNSKEPAWLVSQVAAGALPMNLGILGTNRVIFWIGEAPGDISPLVPSRGTLIHQGETIWFSEPLMQGGFVYIFGSGHVAQELAPLLAHLGFRCIIFDDREDFTQQELFPSAEGIIKGDFNQIALGVHITEEDYVVILTRGHSYDIQAAAYALRTRACYIGLIGSRTKCAFAEGKLRELGFTDQDLRAERFHAPIGIPIRSKTPAELAVSIAGELILTRANTALSLQE